MAGSVKKLQFSEGTDVGAPSDLSLATSTTVITAFVDDAAYVASEGAAQEGSVYLNSTDNVFRMYVSGAWRNATPQSDPADPTKKFLVDLTGCSTGVTSTLDFNNTANRTYTYPNASTTVVGTDTTQTLTNKTLTAPIINGCPTFSLDDTDSSFNLSLQSTSTLTAGRTLTFDVDDGDRQIRLAGNLSTIGSWNIAFTATGNTSVTLPTTGTLATLAGSESLSNKTLASPLVSGGSIDVNAAGNLTIGASVGANNLTLGGSSSSVVVAGDLVVQGTQTILNTSTLEVEDANIVINNGGNDASADGAGITVERTATNGTFLFDSSLASKWKLGLAGAEVQVADVSTAQTLTNKTIDGDDNTIQDIAITALKTVLSDADKVIRRDGSGAVISGNALPNSSTIVTTDSTATLTNKTINGSSNTITNVSLSSGVTGILPVANGGTGQTSQTAAFDALSPTTTKGDIIVFDGTDNVRLAAGTDGFALVADSAQTTGLKYASVITNPMDSAGDIIVGGVAGVATKLDAGASNTVLIGGTSPSFALIANANIDAAAAIDGTKISPAFGSQNISTTGTLAANTTTITVSSGQNIVLSKASGASQAWWADATGAANVYSVDNNLGSLRFLNNSAAVNGSVNQSGAWNLGATSGTQTHTVNGQILKLTENTSSATTDLQVISNNTTGTSKLSLGHTSDADAGYMQYNVSAGTISMGTNGDTNNVIISTNQLYFDGSGGEAELVLGNNSGSRGTTIRYVTGTGFTQIATNGADPAGGTMAMSINTSQVVNFPVGATFATSGGTAATLDFYETKSYASTNFRGASTGSGSTASVTISVTRIGDIVTLIIPATTITTSTTDTEISTSTTGASNAFLESRFRPSSDRFIVSARGISGATVQSAPAMIRVTTGGDIRIFRTGDGGVTTFAAGTSGLDVATTVTYKI